jgi:lipopolysaccharide transport system permease protein
MNGTVSTRWDGEYSFLIRTLLLKDFRIRYRNMSLGLGWSLANPLVMMGVLTFVFTKVFPSTQEHYPLFVLCGLIPFNFFTLAWGTATTSLVDNSHLIKRTRFPREVVPITTVLGNCLHFIIQLVLLFSLALFWEGFNRHWAWLPFVIAMEVIFAIGAGLAFSAINVYIRDARYVVESASLVLFWLVPIFYGFKDVKEEYISIYRFNPLATVVFSFRRVLMENQAPDNQTMINLVVVALLSFAFGWLIFERLKKRFYDYL